MKILCLLLIAGALGACSTTPKGAGPATDRFIVTAKNTPFYKYGPAQGNADFLLPQGRLLTLVKRSFGFSEMRTEDGQTGYVSNDDIGPAPAPTPTPKPEKPRRSRRSSADDFPQPNFDQPPGLWMPDTPTPSFRY